MRKFGLVAVFALSVRDYPLNTVVGFVLRSSAAEMNSNRRIRIENAHFASSSADNENNNNGNNSSKNQQNDPVEAFMEEASLKGADKIKHMSIKERTKRAMLAEAVEDRIFCMYDDLETRLHVLQDRGDGGAIPTNRQDNQKEIQNIAKEIKASQTQYENLVTGEPSVMLGTIDDIGNNSNKSNSKKNEKDNKNDDMS